jgi:predicted helicase
MPIKATDKALKTYYATLDELTAAGAKNEGEISRAFANLLASVGKQARQWTFRDQFQRQTETGANIRIDGALQDPHRQIYGYWEAKDSRDDLEREIEAKLNKGYPSSNIIFEDTRQAILYQRGQRVLSVNLRDPQELVMLLNQFFSYEIPDRESFRQAVREFGVQIKDLGRQLGQILQAARQNDPDFRAAYEVFLNLTRTALNPGISTAQVDEMLIQHLMTERLMRRVFANEDFLRRNVMAFEVEKVIEALTRQSFNRSSFFQGVEPFYASVEAAAGTLDGWQEKQDFITDLYERFFQGYAEKTADPHGIVYTPAEIVDFMAAATEEILQSEFGLALHDEGVVILDPCTGTGNFIVNLMNRLPRQHLPGVYENRLFANEVMLLPYYIASLNIERRYYELTGKYRAFEGLVFADTLDVQLKQQIDMFGPKNTERLKRQREAAVTVILGNPPYNVGQQNENDNNKNRAYTGKTGIDERVRATYAKDSRATNKNALFDAYVKFFRWASDRLNGRDGVVCFVSNNSFLEGIAFDGMRKHLLRDFQRIYILDLKGNIRKDSMRDGLPLGERHTVFGLAAMVGISITILIRKASYTDSQIFYASVDWRSTRQEKFQWLEQFYDAQRRLSLERAPWQELQPDTQHTWLVPENADEFAAYLPMGTKETKGAATQDVEAIFKTYGRGLATTRDNVVYDFDRQALIDRMPAFIEDYNAEVDRYRRAGRPADIDNFVKLDKVKWSEGLKANLRRGRYAEYEESKVRLSQYRPFERVYLFFDDTLNERRYQFPRIFPTPATEAENQVIALTDLGSEKPFMVLMCRQIADLHLVGAGSAAQCFPFYVYEPDGSGRRENITDWALARFRVFYGGVLIEKWDIFYYIYALLHHPTYRARFADNLKRELPRIPLIGGPAEFAALVSAGRAMADLHLNYEAGPEFELIWTAKEGAQLDWRVQKMRLTPDKTGIIYNDTFTAGGIPPEVFGYKLGNRSALEWVLDQYQVTEDKASGIISDPNNPDDPEYIRRLIGQVVYVSLKTLEITAALPGF